VEVLDHPLQRISSLVGVELGVRGEQRRVVAAVAFTMA